jgi:hypothetical protein
MANPRRRLDGGLRAAEEMKLSERKPNGLPRGEFELT